MQEPTVEELVVRDQREAELSLLASLVYSPESVVQSCSWLSPEMFADKQYGKMWEKVIAGGDPEQVAMDLGIFADITLRMSDIAGFVREELYARRIAQDVYMRSVLKSIGNIASSISDRDFEGLQSKITSLAENRLVTGNEATSAKDIDEEFRELVIKRGEKIVKVYVGDLDESVGAFFGKELTIIAARPGIGKTALVLQMARNVANSNKRVLFVSLEMPAVELWARMACPLADLEWREVRAGNISDAQVEDLTDKSLELMGRLEGYMYVADNTYSVQEIHNVALRYKPDILIVDQLPDIRWHDPTAKEVTWYGEAARYLRNVIARRMNIPVILVHQLHRGVEGRAEENKRPVLSDLRWSGELEQVADIVLMAYREDYYKGRPSGVYVVPYELWVRKNRQGNMNACVNLQYNLKEQWFT